jgi:predicted CopG family antitoxin
MTIYTRELNVTTYTTNKRRTISLDPKVYLSLMELGRFGESFSEVVGRLLDSLKEQEKKL